MNIRSLLVCGALLLFASVAYAGSYQRTRDGQMLVWRDVPARGDEATWSGKRDKDGYATGSGVLTWYKAEPTIVTGSNILDTRRYVIMINHYSGTMVRGKFKGAINNVEANGKRAEATSANETDRTSRRKKPTRAATRSVKATPKTGKTPPPPSERIIVDTPELTSAPDIPTPAPEQSPSPSPEEPQSAVPPETAALAAKQMATPPQLAPEQSPSPNPEEPQSAVPKTASLAPNQMEQPPELAPEQSLSPNAEEPQRAVPPETAALAAKQMATPPQLTPEESAPQVAEEPQAEVPPQTDNLTAKQTATPPPEQQTTQVARNTTLPRQTQPDDSQRSLSAPPFELPKPPRTVDEQTVARLDTLYHSAVKANDAAIMDEILADDFVLETDRGASLTKADLIKEARGKRTIYEHQEAEEGTQKVRIWRDTAVVTALLRIKGTREQNPFDYKVWLSETYVRTPTGWRYVFGRASKPDSQ